jgi:hypothetical protein
VGELTLDQYREFALPATQLLIEELAAGDTPVILYTKASSHLLSAAAESGANVLSVDWRVDLAAVRELVGPRIALQGNVDPCVLLGPQEGVRQAARDAVESTGGFGHILNLGHGILQQTPVENARAFVCQAAAVADKVRVEGARSVASLLSFERSEESLRGLSRRKEGEIPRALGRQNGGRLMVGNYEGEFFLHTINPAG